MDTSIYLYRLVRRDWLTVSSLSNFIASYIARLHKDGYGERTIHLYLTGLAHFSYWGKIEGVDLSEPNTALVRRFLNDHLPNCQCPSPCYRSVGNVSAALQLLLKVVPFSPTSAVAGNPVAAELKHFADYLTNTCG